MKQWDFPRKLLDLTWRRLHLAGRRRGLHSLRPLGKAPSRGSARPSAILVLQAAENATVDYYLRNRLAKGDIAWRVVNLSQKPDTVDVWSQDGVLVVICRYINAEWLRAVERRRKHLHDVVFFVDDDLPAMMADRSLPWRARGKVAVGYGRFLDRLERLVGQVWVSTPALAARFTEAARILPPAPCDLPAPPTEEDAALVVYHGTDVHGPERRFAVEIARALSGRPDIRFEISGDRALAKDCADLPMVSILPQVDWPTYRAGQAARSATVFLAPLGPGLANAARAPVKVFDAARLGACGIFADAPAYRDAVRHEVDGLLLPMSVLDWSRAVEALIDDPQRRVRLVNSARAKVERQALELEPLIGEAT
jgi:hypothetical protein